MFFGKFHIKSFQGDLKDLSTREIVMFVPLIFLALLLGVAPAYLLELINESVNLFITTVLDHGVKYLQIP